MGLDDAYVELGVSPGASESEVKAAWRRLVSRWHPDRNASADAAALMQRINRAYDRIRLALVEPAGHPAPAATSGHVDPPRAVVTRPSSHLLGRRLVWRGGGTVR